MKPLDFEYDGQYLSDYGFVVCEFNANGGISEASAASKIVFEKVARNNGTKYSLTRTKYTECLTSTFDICKNPDIYDGEDLKITADEFRDIMRWLNRKEFLPFRFITDEGLVQDIETCRHNASFNVTRLMLDEILYGIRLTMETDAPFGHGAERAYSWSATSTNKTKVISDISDEIGYIYPVIDIKCKVDCDLVITNESEGCSSMIMNCKAGEVITMHGDTNIITTSYASHDINNDFNYEFFRIGNTADRTENIITVSHPCDIVMRYCPIIKYAQL